MVGADYFYELVNPYRLPIERLGMWLTFDRFGRSLLFGKIPGSHVDKQNMQVNMVSIQNVMCNTLTLGNFQRAALPILDNGEFVHESNAFDVAKELNNFDAMGFQVSSRQEDDREALETFTSNMYKDNDSNQYIVGFPWVNDKPPVHEELDSNYGLVLARFKDTIKTLDKDNDKLLQYKENHEKEAQMDFIEKVPLNELIGKRI